MKEELPWYIAIPVGLIFLVLFLFVVIPIIMHQLSELQCQPYKDTISRQEIEIQGLKSQLNEAYNQLNQCRENYDKLIKENITKKDIEEIKGFYNTTKIEINTLNQKFETINNSFVNVYNILIRNYIISLVINVFFVIDLICIALFKNEIIIFSLTWIFSKIKKLKSKNKTDQNDTKNNRKEP
jgi:hypothetical protein